MARAACVMPCSTTSHVGGSSSGSGTRAYLRPPPLVVQGMPPLRYQWFRDGKRLTVATSNSPLLVLVGVAAADSGSYHCQVTNKDGSTASSKALLTVQRVGVLRAAGLAAASSAAGSPAPEASTSGFGAAASATRAAVSTVSRTLPLGGSDRTGLPLSIRLGGSTDGTPEGAGSGMGARRSLSPLISRPVSAAGRFPSAGSGLAAGDAAAGGGGDSGNTGRLSGITVPARRFAASRPTTAPAPQQQPGELHTATLAPLAEADGIRVGAADGTAGASSAPPRYGQGNDAVPAQTRHHQQGSVDAEAAAGSASPLRRARVSEQP